MRVMSLDEVTLYLQLQSYSLEAWAVVRRYILKCTSGTCSRRLKCVPLRIQRNRLLPTTTSSRPLARLKFDTMCSNFSHAREEM